MPRRSSTTEPDERDPAPSDSAESVLGAGLPPVVAVMVTRDPGPALDDALAGLVGQDYGNLSILVIDAGSGEDPTPRIAKTAPKAFVKRTRAEGFGAAANAVKGAVEGATFLLFVHDDVELEPGAVHAMVTEAFRANAGIVGAKLVDWDDRERIRSVGLGSDRFGFGVPIAEAGELDQSQHDTPREVMGVQHAAMLVRADLYADVGGFAPEIVGPGDALDLCWRARVAGARTVVMPAAVARHRATSEIGDGSALHRHALRNTARMVLANYSFLHLLRVLPQAIAASVIDALVSVLSGRFSSAVDVVTAWGWNLAHLPSLPRARRRTAGARRVGDAEVRAGQLRGSARFNAWVRSALDNGDQHRVTSEESSGRELPWSDAGSLAGVLIGLVAVLVTLFGARHLLSSGIPAIRELAPFRDAGSMLAEWWNGWRTTGTGAAVPAPPSLPAAALLVTAAFGHPGVARTLVVLAAIPVGVIGAWRVLAGAARARSRAAVAFAYLAAPVVYDGLAQGRAAVLALYAALPWVVGRVLRASDLLPSSGSGPAWTLAARLALVVALGAIAAPELLLMAAFVVVALAVVEAGAGRISAGRRVLSVGLAGVGLAALLHLPQLAGLLTGSQRWSLLTRGGASSRSLPTFWDAAHLGGSAAQGAFLAVGLVVAAALPLVVARAWRLRLSALTWMMLLGGWAVLILARRGVMIGVGVEEALVCSALGAALGVGLGLEVFGVDVRGGAFGFRQLASVVAGVAALAAVLPMGLVVWGGRFDAPDNDIVETLQTLGAGDAPQFRTLWIGDRDTLPLVGWEMSGPVVAAMTEGVRPDLSTAAPPAEGPGERSVLEAIRLATEGQTSRFGRLVAPAAVRYVVVVGDGNVTGTSTRSRPSGPVADALAAQLDLAPLTIAPGLAVYENRQALPIRATVADDSPLEATEQGGPRRILDAGVPEATPALRKGHRTSLVSGDAGPGTLAVSMTRDPGWSWSGGGAVRRSYGWAQRYAVGPSARRGTLRYRPGAGHLSLLGAQLAVLVVVAIVAAPRRKRRHRVSGEGES